MIEQHASDIHETAKEKGFWPANRNPDVYVAKMMLLVSEVAEIMEAYRKQHGPEALTDEFADVYIRLLDLWAGMYEEGLVNDLQNAIEYKMLVNTRRPMKHGNLI